MKKIYVCQASGNKNRSISDITIPVAIILYFILFILGMVNIIDINTYSLNFSYTTAIFFIGWQYYYSYILPLPNLQINSLNNLLIYLGKRVHYSTKLEDIHHFSIVEDGIILHSDKLIKIPFSEFENVDLISFANSMNKVIENNINFYEILNEDNKIQGFNCLNEDNTKDLRTFMQGGFLTKDIKELQESAPKFIITQYWWWYHEFLIIVITILTIIFSIIDLVLWFFYNSI